MGFLKPLCLVLLSIIIVLFNEKGFTKERCGSGEDQKQLENILKAPRYSTGLQILGLASNARSYKPKQFQETLSKVIGQFTTTYGVSSDVVKTLNKMKLTPISSDELRRVYGANTGIPGASLSFLRIDDKMEMFNMVDGDGGGYVYARQNLPKGVVQRFWIDVPFDPTNWPYNEVPVAVPGSPDNTDGDFYINGACLFSFDEARHYLTGSMDSKHMGLRPSGYDPKCVRKIIETAEKDLCH